MKTLFILISAVLLLIVNETLAQTSQLSSDPVELGDVIFGGKTYQKARAEINDGGDIELLGTGWTSGTGRAATIPWGKAPWDMKKKMEKAREVKIANFKKRPRMEASPAMLVAMWGKPEFSETAYPDVTMLKFNTPEYLIDAYFEKQQAVMFEVERKAGWTPESTEAVLQTMARGEWKYDNGTEIWTSGSARAKLATPKRIRIMSYRWTHITNAPVKKPDAGL